MTRPNSSVNVFVAATGNAFMTDIAGWLVEAAVETGRPARLVVDGTLPSDPSAVNLVVAPHEFYLLSDAGSRAIDAAASVSVPVCTEQPGTSWFEMTSLVCQRSPMVLDINVHGVEALRSLGHDAHHLRIGGTPSMDRRRAGVARSRDLVVLAGYTEHRGAELARLAPTLWPHEVDLRLFSFTRPVTSAVGGLVFSDAKYDLLADSRILLNIHRDDARSGYFEWARLVEAMANGCAVVTEPSSGYEPLMAGEHFVETDDLVATIAELLNDRARCDELGSAAARAVLDDHPLRASLEPLLAEAEVRRPERPARSMFTSRARSQLRRLQQIPVLPVFAPATATRRDIRAAFVAETRHRREIERVRSRRRHGSDDAIERFESSAYANATPEVTVIVTLFDYELLVTDTLDSICASRDVDFEIVVVDDHSTDDGRATVASYLHEHDDVPILLLGREANHGLAAARNLAFANARAEKVMVMDADNLVYPSALRMLSDALEADPGASFAYSILEEFGVTEGLRSAMGWSVQWLCEANYIDAQSMIRRSAWERHGRYSDTEALMFGWEDWEFWLRVASDGGHGVHVARILGRYRTQETSMLATTNLFGDLMTEDIRAMYPALPWPHL